MMTNYDFKVDVWAAGCIFAEMLWSTLSLKRQLLFSARQCQPLSPFSGMNTANFTKEQLLMNCADLLTLHAKFF